MIVVFDMDNTLADEFGKKVRPGVIDLLERLKAEGFVLALWTSSTRQRAEDILALHGLDGYFSQFVFREDYDPENEGLPKDIRRIDGTYLVDDDPEQIRYAKSIKRAGFLIKPYRGGSTPDTAELDSLYESITAARRRRGLFGWFR